MPPRNGLCCLPLILPVLLALIQTLPSAPTGRPPGILQAAESDTTAHVSPRLAGTTSLLRGAPGPDITYPLDPVPVPADSQWWDGFSRPGVRGEVYSAAVFEGDLVVGGAFSVAGKTRSTNVARWDGVQWAAVEGDLSNLMVLAVYDGHLVAGKIGSCGAYLVRVWEGTSWGVLGDGIKAWDDSDTWHPQCWEWPDWVSALQVYDGKLIAGGMFSEVAGNPGSFLVQWDGASWSSLGSEPDRQVEAMTVYDGKLVVGGSFRNVGDLAASRIAAWDGETWSAFGQGINPDITSGRYVYTLTVYDSDIYAGGMFNKAGSTAADRLARWDGDEWSSIGFEAGGYVGDDAPAVFASAVYDGMLIVGGRFNKTEGGVADYIAAWNGSSWEELGSGVSGTVYSLTAYDDVLIAGGEFAYADGHAVYSVAMWDGEAWYPMGSGQGLQAPARTLVVHGGDLVAGGEFAAAGDAPAKIVASWDGAGWHPMDEGWSWESAGGLMSAGGDLFGMHGNVVKRWNGAAWEDHTADFGEEIRTVGCYRDQVAAAGAEVALWNGLSWAPLGPGSDGYVNALLEVDGDLIAGGHFTEIGGVEALNIARWNGSAWSAMGDGLRNVRGAGIYYEDVVSALCVFDGNIVAGGYFDRTGDEEVKYIAGWDGEAWQPLYKGVARDTDPHVFAIAEYNGTLVAAGDFRWAGDFPAWNIARWNGGSWSPMGSGIGIFYRVSSSPVRYTVDALAAHDGSLYAGGFFNHTGGKPSFNIARWRDAFPGMVMHFRAAPSGQDVHLAWTNPDAEIFKGTLVRYSLYAYPLESDDGEPVPNGNGGRFEGPPGSDTSFVFAGVTGVTHYLTAFAYDDAYNYSTPAFAALTMWDSIPPPALPHFEAAAGTCAVRLAWTNPFDPEFEGTLIRFSREAYPLEPDVGEPVPNGNDGVFEDPAEIAVAFVHEDLDCDTTYYYTAWAFDETHNYSDPSHARARSTDPPEAMPPTGFTASGTVEGILLEWTNPAQDGFESTTIRFSEFDFPAHRLDGHPVPNGNDGVFEGPAGTDSSFVHSGVTAHRVYYYAAWATYENGAVSMPVRLFKVAPDTERPDPPTSLTAVAIPQGIRLHWKNALDLDVMGLLLRFSPDTYPAVPTDGEPLPNGADGFFEGVSGSHGQFAHTGLVGCHVYYYTGWSYDEFMRYSDPVHVSYLSMIDTVAYFDAIPGDRSVNLCWAGPADETCEYHDAVAIRYATNGFAYTVRDGEPVPNGNDGRFIISPEHDLDNFEHGGLEPGVTYNYSAFVVSDTPERASLPVLRTAVPTKVMPGVTGFSAAGTDRAVSLTWRAPSAAEVAEVRIRYSTEAPPQVLEEGTAVENGNDGVFEAEPGMTGAYTHSGLQNDTTYYYSIWALDDAGFYSQPEHAQAVAVDDQPPDLLLFVLQNPYLSEYLDIYLLASEEVIPDSVRVCVGADTLSMCLVDGASNVWRCDYTLVAPAASILLEACACDLAGNKGYLTSEFAAGYLTAGLGGSVSSPDGRLRVSIPPNAMARDAFILVTPRAGGDRLPYPGAGRGQVGAEPVARSGELTHAAYSIGPAGLLRDIPARLEWAYAASDITLDIPPDRIYVEHDGLGQLACYVDPERQVVQAETHEFGTFRLATGEPGASLLVDPGYLRVEPPKPNPFSQETTVRLEVRATQHIWVVVYDISGREVSRLLDGVIHPGIREIVWNGVGGTGRTPSGVYFLKISCGSRSATCKMLLLR